MREDAANVLQWFVKVSRRKVEGAKGDGRDQESQAGHEMNIPHLLLVFYHLLILSQCFL